MQNIKFILMILFTAHSVLARGPEFESVLLGQLLRVEANPSKGFNFPFFLYVPMKSEKTRNLLIVPNNTGSTLLDTDSQMFQTQRQALGEASIADKISSILLVPGFPRPDVEPPIYTHSLSRSTLTVKDGPLKRIDLQLIAMAEAARKILNQKFKVKLRPKVFLSGFSASAMFVNRFAFIHPSLVAGVAAGAPGGWPLAPQKEFKGQTLPYPIGISDLSELTGKPIDLEALKKVPFFFFIGDRDENDSVVFRDGYTKSDEDLVFLRFGKKPVDRWPIAEKLYLDAGLNIQFKLYKNLGHDTDQNTRNDVIKFFNSIPVD